MLSSSQIDFDKSFVKNLERYLHMTLHREIDVVKSQQQTSLPTFLARSYHFYEANIIGRQCLLIGADENATTPTNIAKHVSLVRSEIDAIVIYVTPTLSAHNRSRLIALGVSFVVPGNQLYIPELAMDLREHFRAFKLKTTDVLSPAAQAVLFHYLLDPESFGTKPSEIAKQLHYSPMSIGRAFDDLVSLELARSERLGRERRIHFVESMEHLLDLARPLMRNPVSSIKYLIGSGEKLGLQVAGETALAELTDLTPPRLETFATSARRWSSMAREFSLIQGNRYEHDFVIEAWSYDPLSLSNRSVVDPLSLYAQFKDHSDERVRMAADSLLRKGRWYQG